MAMFYRLQWEGMTLKGCFKTKELCQITSTSLPKLESYKISQKLKATHFFSSQVTFFLDS